MKLNQVIAIEKGTKNHALSGITTIYHTFQKPALFEGFAKTYRPIDEEGQRFPDETKRVQMRADALLDQVATALSELMNVTAAKDWGNTTAKSDVVVDGEVLLHDVPATFLLFLEKQLSNMQAEISRLPELDPAHAWQHDDNTGLWRSSPVESTRPKKVHKVIVLHPPTKEHPAQTQLVQEDQVVGHWTTVQLSGAIQTPRKEKLMQRIRKLIDAVKMAREAANETVVEKREVAEPIFRYLLAP